MVSFPFELRIAGSGEDSYLASLKNLAAELGIDRRVTWLDWVGGEGKFRTLSEAGLLVLTSQNENFANVVIESLSVGTPVLLSDQVGLCDYVLEKDLGWVTPLDVAQITLTLENAFRDEAKRRRIREQAPRLIRRDFEEREVAVGYFKAYQRFCPTPGIRAPERPLLGDTPFQEGKR